MSAGRLLSLCLLAALQRSSADIDLNEDEFLLAVDIGTSGLISLQPLLTSTYRGSAFYAHIAQAETHSRHGRISDAAAAYSYVLANYALSDYDAAPIHLGLGNALSHMSRTAEAEQEYKYAAQARRYAHLAYYCLGLLYARSGRTVDAAQALETALFFRPAFFAAVHALGSLQIIRGNVEKGLRLYDSALQLLVDSGVLPPEGEEEGGQGQGQGSGPPPSMGGNPLSDHLVRHVLHVFHVPSEDVANRDAAAKHAHAVAVGKSLRKFLGKVSSLDLAAFHRAVGFKLADTGALQDGLAHLRRAVSLSPPGTPDDFSYLLLWTTLAQPVAYADGEDVWNTRATTVKNVRQALEDRVAVVHPEQLFELYQLQYQLPFSGLPAHHLMRDIARLFAASELPVLPYAAPRLFSDYPHAIAVASGKAQQQQGGAGQVEVGADGAATPVPDVNAKVSPFHMPWLRANPDFTVIPTPTSATAAATASSSSRATAAVVRVGFISFQMYDCAVGHLFHRLAQHLKGYGAAVRAQQGSKQGLDLFARRRRKPSMGGGTTVRYECPGEGQEGATEGKDGCSAGVDPLVRRGYITVPGVASFHVTLVRMTKGGDNLTQALGGAVDQQLFAGSRPFDVEGARKVLTDARLDVLVAADPGIQPELYALMFGRVAPVQVALWGTGAVAHTLTLGLEDTVDYHVVGDKGAADGLQEQMLEQTVRLGDAGLYFPNLRPVSTAERFAASRRHGLLEGRHLYLVPSTLNSLHPAFDDVLLGVLAADPEGEALCLYEQGQELWLATTRERLAAHPLAQMYGHSLTLRVRFTTDFQFAMHRAKWALMSAAEVILDTFPVGLSLTALEAVSMGTPVVTLPSRQPLRPFAAGVLSSLNLTHQLVARDVPDYIAKAVKLATDAEYRRGIKGRLLGRKSLLEWTDGPVGAGAGSSTAHAADADTAATGGNGNGTTVISGFAIDPSIDAENRAWIAHMRQEGYGDTARSTLNDWLSFLGRVGRPWALDRVAAEKEAAAQPAAKKRKGAAAARKQAESQAGGRGGGGGAGGAGSRSRQGKAAPTAKPRTNAVEPR